MEVTKFIMVMGHIYGSKMSVTRGKVHKYLGMDLDYTGDKCVKISMIKYVDKVIKDFPEKVTNKLATLASDLLFDISEDDPGKYSLKSKLRSYTIPLHNYCSSVCKQGPISRPMYPS